MTTLDNKHGGSIRDWWTRKTKKVGRMILISSIASLIGAVLFFRYAPPELVARIQTFNGAMTVPVAGAIWVAAFVFQFLIPSREVAFRSQEALERMETRVTKSFEALDRFMAEKAVPALESFQRVVTLFEEQYFKNIQDTIYVCQYAAKNAVDTAKATETMATEIHRDALPAIAAAARIMASLEKQIDSGLLDRLKTMADAASTLGPVKGGATAPDLSRSITILRNRTKAKKDTVVAPTKVEAPVVPPPPPPPSFHEALEVGERSETASSAALPSHPRIMAVPVHTDTLLVERSSP